MKIALIPIDNRPVCYSLAKEIADIDSDLELFLPDKSLLGGLQSVADVDGILNWFEQIEEVDAIIVSLDTIAYGGLISSRRCGNSLEEIKDKLEIFKEKLQNKSKKVYAFSSVMRISNNNINEEEKKYWEEYGQKIFEYSYNFHKEGTDVSDVPQEIINDYLATRRRNFEINKMYIDWLEEGIFDTLVFSKDDCAEFGFNVLESQILQRIIGEKKLSGLVKTGADEIPLTLFARAVCDYNNYAPKFFTKFSAPQYKDLISNYEDISIEKSAQAQIDLAGGKYGILDEQDADMVLLINNFEEHQGEIVMGVNTKPYHGWLSLPDKPFMIADVRFANGADNELVKKLLGKKLNTKNFYGYSAWNTSANTLGSLICAAVVRYFATNFNEVGFIKLQMIRFLDDWAYQANVRQILKEKGKREKEKEARADFRKLKSFMLPYEKKLGKIFKLDPEIKYKFPWKRFFEVEVIIK